MGSTSDVRGQNTQRGAFVHSLQVVHDEEKLVYFGAQTTVVPCKAITEQVETSRKTWYARSFFSNEK